jgi:two-component system, LytTR family, response regulator
MRATDNRLWFTIQKISNAYLMKEENTGMLLLPTANEMMCIPVDNIVRIEASSSYSKVYCRDQTFPIVAAKVLLWFEKRLPGQLFARVHRTHLVNVKYMVSIRKNDILLESGLSIALSRRKKKSIYNNLFISWQILLRQEA